MNRKKIIDQLKGWTENEVTSCAATTYLATAQKAEKGIILTLYKRYEHYSHDPFAVVECKADDFSVWYPKSDTTSKATVLSSGSEGYGNLIRNIGYYVYGKQEPYIDAIFASEEDKEIASSFLGSFTEKTNDYTSPKRVSSLPSPWKEFIWYQIAVLEHRLKKKHQKRDQRKEKLFSFLKDPTDGFKNWVWNKVMEDTQYVFYKPLTGTKVKIGCSVCGEDGILKRTEVKNLGKQNAGNCPFCKAKITFLPAGIQKSCNRIDKTVSFMQRTSEGFVYRIFEATRVYQKKDLPFHTDRLTETARWFISDISDTGFMLECSTWKEKKDGWFAPDFLYPATVSSAIRNTKYRYSGIDVLAKTSEKMRHALYLLRWEDHPILEAVAKAGFHSVISDSLSPYYGPGSHILDQKAKDLFGALKLPRAEVRRIKRLGYTNNSQVILLLQKAWDSSVTVRDNEIREIIDTEMAYHSISKLFSCMKKASLTAHKAVKYVIEQAKDYPGTRYGNPIDEAIGEYDDYLQMAEDLRYSLKDRGVTMRKSRRKAHQDITAEYNMMRDKIRREKEERKNREMAEKMVLIREEVNKNHADAMNLRSNDFLSVGLWTPEALKEEGKALHNCIGTYAEKVANGKTMIFAVRKKDAPEKPFCAFEYADQKIIQCRADHNAEAPVEVKAFANVFAEKMRKEKLAANAA